MGSDFLSQAVGISKADYEKIYERYLIEKGYICRTLRGRIITKTGKQLINKEVA